MVFAPASVIAVHAASRIPDFAEIPRICTPRCREAFSAGRYRRRQVLNYLEAPEASANTTTGIKEVQIIQWFVQPGARVEQFDKLCEVQSDKAATEVPNPH